MKTLPEIASVKTRCAIPILQGRAHAEIITFTGLCDGREHIALQFGPRVMGPTLVRMHSECLTGDVFGSQRCDCGQQLHESLERLSEEGGLLLYLRQEGRGIGLYAKMEAYLLQMSGLDTYEANQRLGFSDDSRDYAPAAQMLHALQAPSIRLLTNNPDKVEQLRTQGVSIEEVVPTGVYANRHNLAYLQSKINKTHHMMIGVKSKGTPE
ncbi:GTP cyclohydrolase II [Pseudomonas viridiflava]|nr:GTP cyclohydrolase II [Pseudomonas viridiflava]